MENTMDKNKLLYAAFNAIINGAGIKKAFSDRPKASSHRWSRVANEIQHATPGIIGYFLDTEHREEVDCEYRESALEAAVQLIDNPAANEADKQYLQRLIEEIAEEEDDDLQETVKMLLMSCAGNTELSEIALDEDEDLDTRLDALGHLTDIECLLDIMAESEDEEVRLAAKKRITELR